MNKVDQLVYSLSMYVWSRTRKPVKLTYRELWLHLYNGNSESSQQSYTLKMSRLTVFVSSFAQTDFAGFSKLSSAKCTKSLKKSTAAPVVSVPLRAYPVMYFSVAIISMIYGVSGVFLKGSRKCHHLPANPGCGILNIGLSLVDLFPFQGTLTHFCPQRLMVTVLSPRHFSSFKVHTTTFYFVQAVL